MPDYPLFSTPDTTPIHRLIRTTRRRLRSSWVATGAGVTTGVLLCTLLAVTLLDLTIPLWPIFRLAALLVVVVPAAAMLAVRVLWPLVRRLTAWQVAHRIEAHVPKMHNRLLCCIDLDDTERRARQSVVFYRRLVGEVLERLNGFKPSAVIDRVRLRRAGWYAGGALAAFAIAFFAFSDRMPTAMARVFSPFADIPPASGVIYTIVPGNTKILRGEEIPFVVTVEKGEPDQLRLELKPENGTDSLWYDLQPQQEGRWTLNLTGLERSFAYRIHGGGTWSHEYHITLLDRPTITGLHTVVNYPQYMDLPEPQVGPPQVSDVTGPQHSIVDVVVEADGDVAAGEIEILEPRSMRVQLAQRPERPWFAEKPPAGARLEGLWPGDPSSRRRPAPLQGMHGHGFQGAPSGFLVQKGETLYVDVSIPPDKMPESLMLQWCDDISLEHRAVWGADKIPLGTMDTASYRRVGPVPTAGAKVRLEVPAALVDLDGKTLRGLHLLLFNGQATLRCAGALGSDQIEKVEFHPAKSFAMRTTANREWSGSFPLDKDGFYRVKLTNELGYANKTMKEAKYVAIIDQPPVVLLERPGEDITLGEPAKVPLSIAAFDDFGLADLTLHLQRGDGAPFEARPIKHYPQPLRSDTVVTTLDLTTLQMKGGELVRYHVEARDRKGQSAVTKDFTIRLVADRHNADKELAQLDKRLSSFQDDLEKLIAEQEKVRQQVEKAAAQPEPAAEKPQEPPARRDQLAEMAKQEQRNSQLSEQMAENLKQLAGQAAKAQMLPPQLARETQHLHESFQNRAVQPLKNLTEQMKQGTDPKNPPADLKQMQRMADQLQKDLEAMRERTQSVAKAENQVRTNAEQALKQLEHEMVQQDSKLTAQELAELQKAVKAMRQEMEKLEGQQGNLMRDNQSLLPEREQRQAALEKAEDRQFAATRQLQGSEEMRRAQQQAGVRNEESGNRNPAPQLTAEKPRFAPALGGPRPELPPRSANRGNTPPDRQGQLHERQADRMDQLSEAEQSLRSDEQSLQNMREQLERAMTQSQQGNQRPGIEQSEQPDNQRPAQSAQGDRQLSETLQSPAMQRATQMAERLRQMRRQEGQQPGEAKPSESHAATPNTHGGTSPVAAEAELARLDPATRAAILKLQPQIREELLQGMRDAGPDGYQKFIEDYFKRLAEVKK